MRCLLILAILGLFSSSSFAQSPFKPLPKMVKPNRFAHDVFTPDSVTTAWRFIADIAAYSEPGNIAEAGLGYGIQNLKYDYTMQKWYCNWSINAVGFAGGSVVPNTPSSIGSAAIMVGALNNLVMIGPQYNFGTKQFGIAVSIGISFNN